MEDSIAMDVQGRIELRALDREVRRLEAMLRSGEVTERAAQLRLEMVRRRQRELREGVPWSIEKVGQVVLK